MARGTVITTRTKDGKKRYKTVIRINGKQQWRTWDRKRDAEDYLDELSPDVRDHTYREIKKATFAEYVSTWRGINLNDRIGRFTNAPELRHSSHELCGESDQAQGDLSDHTQCSF
jgi:hypothetical protein